MKEPIIFCAYTELRSPSELIPHPRNPNTHPKSQVEILARILKRGWRAPITISKRSGFITRGHGRLLAAQSLGLSSVPVDMQDYESESVEVADLLADNEIARQAVMDESLASSALAHVGIEDYAYTGYDEENLVRLLKPMEDENSPKTKKTEKKQNVIIKGATLATIKPSDEEIKSLTGKKFIVEYSGGVDSTASTIWCKHFFPENEIELCYADLGADWPGFEIYLHKTSEILEIPLMVVRSEKNIIDELLRVGNWPNFMGPWCHKLLHQALDGHLLKHKSDDVIVIRGGRLKEKSKRSKENTNRYLSVDRNKEYTYFQPLYFTDKDSSENILAEYRIDKWDGYRTGLRRTACRVCPGQTPGVYAAIRNHYPVVFSELEYLQSKLKGQPWHPFGSERLKGTFCEMADYYESRHTDNDEEEENDLQDTGVLE